MKTTPRVDYDLLAVFVAVADEASFSKAAAKLDIGKGTVSRAIARLESRVGAELIHRTTHKVALSTAGTALYERTAAHLASLRLAVSDLPERAEQPSGELRVTATVDVGVVVLPKLIVQFALRYPAIKIDLHVTNTRVDLVAEGFDLAIRNSRERLRDSTLTARKLGDIWVGNYASPSYLARRGTPLAFGDPKHDWVVYSPALAVLRPNKEFRPHILADEFIVVRDLLREGAGVGLLPVFLAEPCVADGELELVLPEERRRLPGGHFLVYPSSGQVPRKVRALGDFLVERWKA